MAGGKTAAGGGRKRAAHPRERRSYHRREQQAVFVQCRQEPQDSCSVPAAGSFQCHQSDGKLCRRRRRHLQDFGCGRWDGSAPRPYCNQFIDVSTVYFLKFNCQLVAAMIHVGIKEALMAINGHLEQLRTTANLQLRPSISNHKEYFNVKKTDNEVVADFSSDGWTKLEGKYGGGKDGTRRRNEDSALLPLSFQQHYWSAQLNFRHFWTLFCWTHSCSRKSLVDLTDSDDNAMCEQTASIDPREGEVTMLKWLEYWNMRRKSQKGSASSSRRAGGSLQECENDDRKTRRKTDAAIKLSAKKGRRPKRSKRSSSSEDDDDEEEVDFDNDEYFVSEPSQPLTGERFGDHLEPQSIMMIVEGPIASGKTSLVVSTASRLGMNVIEINSSQIRNAVAIKKLFSEAAHSHTIASSAVVDLSTAVEETANADNGGSVILFEEVLGNYE